MTSYKSISSKLSKTGIGSVITGRLEADVPHDRSGSRIVVEFVLKTSAAEQGRREKNLNFVVNLLFCSSVS